MYCPSCGAKNSIEQNFCRSCGFNLEDTSKSLLAQFPSAGTTDLLKRRQSLERFGKFAFGGFGIVLVLAVAGIIYAIVSGMILSGKNPLVGILLAAFLVFAALMLAYVFLKEDFKEKRTKLKQTEPNELGTPKTTGKLLPEKPFEMVPSVVENSTELLPLENKTRKFE